MGLFRRNNDDGERIAELKSEIQLLRQRLDEADAAKAGLEQRVSSIDALSEQVNSQAGDVNSLSSQVRQLTDRLETPPADPSPPPPPPPMAGGVDDRVEEVERRLAELDAVDERLDALSNSVTRQAQDALSNGDQIDSSQIGDMANRLEDLSVAVATHTTQLAATKDRVDAIEPTTEQADDDTREVVDEMRQQLGQMAERMTSLDHRLTNVSTELANQLTELSRDIDTVSQQPAATLPPPRAALADGETDAGIEHLDDLELRLAEKFDMAIDDVRDSQERLAAEQARYEIKFREDLAELAERLRRPRTG